MATDFSNIGFDVNSSEDVYNLIADNTDKVETHICGDMQYAVLNLDEHSGLYYYGSKDGINGESCEIAFVNPFFQDVEFVRWVNKPKNDAAGMIQVFCDEGDTVFPLNVVIPNAYEYRDADIDERLIISMTLFPRSLDVHKSFDECKESNGGGFCLNGCIPCGTFPLPGNEDKFVQSATALMSGTVIHAEKLVNNYTGNEFWFVRIVCCGQIFAVVADPEFAPDGIESGDFIDGYFWISGLIVTYDEKGD